MPYTTPTPRAQSHPPQFANARGTLTLRDIKNPKNSNCSYEIVQELGKGGFGVVYLCKDSTTREIFVIKETLGGGDKAMAVAQNEVERLKDLSHPQIIHYFGCEEQGGKLFIFMEYVSRGSVLKFIKSLKRPLNEAETLAFVQHALEGLSYIHEKGIIHCDLKCDNLLIGNDNKLKIGDFGIALQIQLNTLGQSVFETDQKRGGSFYFIAPEVQHGQPFGRSSDIWSLGCAVVEMLNGYPPYAEKYKTVFEYIAAWHRNELIFEASSLVPKASTQLKQFLSCLLKVDQKNRYRTATFALERFKLILQVESGAIAAALNSISLEDTSAEKYIPKAYDVLEKLGKGGFGIVHKCRDTQTFRFFAIKETNMTTAQDLVIAENEISQLKGLCHPHVIEYYGSQRKDGKIVIFMEYLSGGSVRAIIDKFGPISEQQTLKFIEHTLDGLGYIHGKNIIHSDIKCDNLLLDQHSNLKLGDFGIAMETHVDSLGNTVANEKGGTLYFLAPEVLLSQGFGRSADLWSLGCTIVEMLTGNPPYGHMKTFEYMAARSLNNLTFDASTVAPKASVQLKLFLGRLLKIDRAQRHHDAIVALNNFKHTFPNF